MSTSNYDTISKNLTTGAIIALVIGTVFGLILCIGTIIIIVCMVKHCNRSSRVRYQGTVQQQQQQPYQYNNYSVPQYPSNINNVNDYPPPYQSVPPPYNAPNFDPIK